MNKGNAIPEVSNQCLCRMIQKFIWNQQNLYPPYQMYINNAPDTGVWLPSYANNANANKAKKPPRPQNAFILDIRAKQLDLYRNW